MLWVNSLHGISVVPNERHTLFAAFGDFFMDNSWITNALPFWILGVPLAVAVISYLRIPRHRDQVSQDYRDEHRTVADEPANPMTAKG